MHTHDLAYTCIYCIPMQTNNYQAIVVTDTFSTHVIFTYECGGMQWSTSGNAAAVIGFNAGGNIYHNHPLSGTKLIREAVDCSMNNITNMLLTLPSTPSAYNIVPRRCLMKYSEDKNILSGSDINALAEMLEPCPCTFRQAILDMGRYIRQNGHSLCYVSSKPLPVDTPTGRRLQLTQQCCFDRLTG